MLCLANSGFIEDGTIAIYRRFKTHEQICARTFAPAPLAVWLLNLKRKRAFTAKPNVSFSHCNSTYNEVCNNHARPLPVGPQCGDFSGVV